MIADLDSDVKTKAKHPHNLFMVNLALFHLMLTPATIALDIGMKGILLPLCLSLSVILYTYLRASNKSKHEHEFIHAHWRLAFRRYRWLMISYGMMAALLGVGWLLSLSADPSMAAIIQTIFIRISIMPVVIMVMISFFLESTAINQASNGEVPDDYASDSRHTDLSE